MPEDGYTVNSLGGITDTASEELYCPCVCGKKLKTLTMNRQPLEMLFLANQEDTDVSSLILGMFRLMHVDSTDELDTRPVTLAEELDMEEAIELATHPLED